MPKATPKEQKPMTYGEAMAELEQLVETLQDPNCDVDNLCRLTARSIELIHFCKDRLTHTDEELTRLLADLNPNQ